MNLKFDSKLKIGISSCLLGMNVRYDGGHKKDDFIINILGESADLIPVCPELEAGFGVPREEVRMVGSVYSPKVIGLQSGEDKTKIISNYTSKRIIKNDIKNLDGFILKKNSPSCGMEKVKIYDSSGIPKNIGTGVFARTLMDKYPNLPIEEEGRLRDLDTRENFIVRIIFYRRLLDLFRKKFNRTDIIEFHTSIKYLMLAHSPKHYRILGELVGNIKTYQPKRFKEEYKKNYMEGLKLKSTVKKNVNVLQHIVGFMKKYLSSDEKKELLNIISDYHNNLVPLIVPLTLLKHYIIKYNVSYIKDQFYINPPYKELMLRNHV
jgi:uncharacterized protein YbgA (DUF1722 family)/uncharacterized protein YbbK (DUF523 family)